MGYKLNVDMWHVVNPEDQKTHRLSRGDEVPSWALPEGDDLEAVTTRARVPIFVKDDDDVRASSGTTPAKELSGSERERETASTSPQQARDKK